MDGLHVHGVKGSAATLEAAGRAGDPMTISTQMQGLRQKFARLVVEIDAALSD